MKLEQLMEGVPFTLVQVRKIVRFIRIWIKS